MRLAYSARLHQLRGETQATYEQAESSMALATEQEFTQYVAMGMIHRGWALAVQGKDEVGLTQTEQGMATYQTVGNVLARPSFLIYLAQAHGQAGRIEEELQVVTEGLILTEKTVIHNADAELIGLKVSCYCVRPTQIFGDTDGSRH